MNAASLRRGMVLIAVAVIVLAVFSPVTGNDFVRWADDANLLNNDAYRGFSWPQIRWMFTTFHWGHYQPLAWLTFAADWRIGGHDPRVAHATNVLLHSLNAVLLCVLIATLLRVVFGKEVGARPGFHASCAIGALVFALHPLRVETVAWASTRGDLLCASFWMLTILAYVNYATAAPSIRRRALYLASILAYTLAVLSRGWAMTLPLVLFVLDVYPLRRLDTASLRRRILEKVPFALLAAEAAAAALLARKIGMGMESFSDHGWASRFAQAAYGLCFYLGKTVMPIGLSPLYLLKHSVDPFNPKYVLCVAVVAGLTLLLFRQRKRWPWAWAAWLCYGITVAPVLGFAQSGWQLVADRYGYLPLLPLGVLAAGGLVCVPIAAVRVVAGTIVALWAGVTMRQIEVWHDTASLWNAALRIDPGNYVARNLLGRERERLGDLAAAGRDYDEALRLDPRYIDAYLSRGRLRYRQRDLAGAEADFDEVIRLNPTTEDALLTRGMLRQERGDAAGAFEDYDMALLVNPDSADTLRNRAILYYKQGRLIDAINDYGALLKRTPDSADAWLDRGRLKKEAGDWKGALEDFSAAIRLAPGSADAFADRAVVRRALGDAAGAVGDCTEAIRLKPDAPLAYFNRGILFVEQGKTDAAAADFQNALDRAPAGWAYRPQLRQAMEKVGRSVPTTSP